MNIHHAPAGRVGFGFTGLRYAGSLRREAVEYRNLASMFPHAAASNLAKAEKLKAKARWWVDHAANHPAPVLP